MRRIRRARFTRKVTASIGHGDGLYLAEVTLVCCPGDPGRTYGDPYDCYPPEPPTAEVDDILIVGIEDGGDEAMVGQHVGWELDMGTLDELADCAFDAQASEDEAAWEEHCERKLDARREGD
jgi:hypothetical protein